MSNPGVNIHALDAAYKPFPPFSEWAAKTKVETGRWDRYLAALENRPEASTEALRRAREVVKRAAAVDTGAIEGLYEVDRGFTFTVAFEISAWETKLAEKGENVRSLFEAQLNAYDYVLDLATKAEQISEAAFRKLHEVVCAAQETYRVITSIGFQDQPLPKGRYKVLPNHVTHTREGTTHSYAPVDVTPIEMARLMNELRSEEFQNAHPVMQAAYSHYGFVVIHPFADGNGRVARALASVFAYRAISMPIMILSEHKETYLDALEAADRGEYQAFVEFMLSRSLDTLTLVGESMRGVPGYASTDRAAAINALYITRGGYSQGQVDGAGRRFLDLLIKEFGNSIAQISGPNIEGNSSSFTSSVGSAIPDPSYRLFVRDNDTLVVCSVELRSSPPARARAFRHYAVWLPRDANGDDDVHLIRLLQDGAPLSFDPSRIAFSARTEELIPGISGILQVKASMFAERLMGEILADLEILIKKGLHG